MNLRDKAELVRKYGLRREMPQFASIGLDQLFEGDGGQYVERWDSEITVLIPATPFIRWEEFRIGDAFVGAFADMFTPTECMGSHAPEPEPNEVYAVTMIEAYARRIVLQRGFILQDAEAARIWAELQAGVIPSDQLSSDDKAQSAPEGVGSLSLWEKSELAPAGDALAEEAAAWVKEAAASSAASCAARSSTS